MMSLDEAIKHAEEVAEENQAIVDSCDYYGENMAKCEKCAEEHRQLAEWLKELKQLREQSGDEELDFVPEHKKIPCTMTIGKPCEDAISRQAVLNILDDVVKDYIKENDFDKAQGVAWIKVQKLPSVTPQPKTGHWIGHREHCENLGVIPSGLGAYEWCSECDCGIDVREWHKNHYNYCPNCGAKMFESQKSEG